MLLFHNTQSLIKLNKLSTAKTIKAMLMSIGYADWDLTVSFITNEEIKRLNSQYRHKDQATDILSFPTYINVKTPGVLFSSKQHITSLGDIFISLPYVKTYCDENNVLMEKHMPILYAHGISHLLGFDHETQEQYQLMHPFETKILNSYSIYLNEYNPLEEGLYESWNWTHELDL